MAGHVSSASSDRLATSFPLLETVDLLQELSLSSQVNGVPGDRDKAVYGENRSLGLGQAHGAYGAFPAQASQIPTSLGTEGISNTNPSSLMSSYCDSNSLYPQGYFLSGLHSPGYQNVRFAFDQSGNLNTFSHHMNSRTSREASSFGQSSFGYINHMYPNHGMYGLYGNGIGSGCAYGSLGYNSWKHGQGWYPVDVNRKTRNLGYGRNYGEEKADRLNELCRGPRSGDSKNQQGFQSITPELAEQDDAQKEEECLQFTGDPKDYNGDNFPEVYANAKFFVIKSYSEDDVHKSIKYGVWSSTPNGNKKLDAAYHEAKEYPDGCPVFLLFSVNASGQFVGLAEMVGPIDFNKTVEYWQQDKWIGCFPVKWHIIKDVPNSLLRHITLENNENKPVTNSRDTQEVNLEHGMKIIKIFKEHASKMCILDDFGFYETRQKIIREKKTKLKKQAVNRDTEEPTHPV